MVVSDSILCCTKRTRLAITFILAIKNEGNGRFQNSSNYAQHTGTTMANGAPILIVHCFNGHFTALENLNFIIQLPVAFV